jgi:hypothetical protein
MTIYLVKLSLDVVSYSTDQILVSVNQIQTTSCDDIGATIYFIFRAIDGVFISFCYDIV